MRTGPNDLLYVTSVEFSHCRQNRSKISLANLKWSSLFGWRHMARPSRFGLRPPAHPVSCLF